jgi:ribA/ribD-fused uncharacterized protein
MEEMGKNATLPTRIEHFAFEWGFLSNFYPSEVRLWVVTDDDGISTIYPYAVPDATIEIYASVEHAYQASKTLRADKRWIFQLPNNPKLTAGQAKHLGAKLKEQGLQREDWHQVNIEIMRGLLRQKFSGSILKRKLMSTFSAVLVEGNWWHDTFWGVCKGKLEGRTCRHGEHDPLGENHLGLLLMELRQEVSGVVPSTPAAV